jgi:hypothetical protein
VFPVATQALAVPRLRARRRWRAPSRVWVRSAATAVSPVIPASLLELFLVGGEQPFDHRGELVAVGGEPVDAGVSQIL